MNKEETFAERESTHTKLPKTGATKDRPLSTCLICGRPATCLVDGDPSCAGHIEQVYEHQVEDYTSRHLVDDEWKKV